jgi:hypothetical protein
MDWRSMEAFHSANDIDILIKITSCFTNIFNTLYNMFDKYLYSTPSLLTCALS